MYNIAAIAASLANDKPRADSLIWFSMCLNLQVVKRTYDRSETLFSHRYIYGRLIGGSMFNFAALILPTKYRKYLLISQVRAVYTYMENMVYPFVNHAGPRGPENEITLGRVRCSPNRIFYFGESYGTSYTELTE